MRSKSRHFLLNGLPLHDIISDLPRSESERLGQLGVPPVNRELTFQTSMNKAEEKPDGYRGFRGVLMKYRAGLLGNTEAESLFGHDSNYFCPTKGDTLKPFS